MFQLLFRSLKKGDYPENLHIVIVKINTAFCCYWFFKPFYMSETNKMNSFLAP